MVAPDTSAVGSLRQSVSGFEDLIQLPILNDDSIFENMKTRYNDDQIYTFIGSSAILSINPFKSIESSSD